LINITINNIEICKEEELSLTYKLNTNGNQITKIITQSYLNTTLLQSYTLMFGILPLDILSLSFNRRERAGIWKLKDFTVEIYYIISLELDELI